MQPVGRRAETARSLTQSRRSVRLEPLDSSDEDGMPSSETYMGPGIRPPEGHARCTLEDQNLQKLKASNPKSSTAGCGITRAWKSDLTYRVSCISTNPDI
jgi:hypothetical protein